MKPNHPTGMAVSAGRAAAFSAVVESPIDEWEPVISDWRMSVIEGRLRDLFDVPDDTQFCTGIQPPRYVERSCNDKGWTPAMAVFFVRSPHPTVGPDIVTHGTVQLQAFLNDELDRQHYVVLKEDLAHLIFAAVLKSHLATLQNLQELIR